MPKNKEALSRYRIINRYLLDFKYVTLRKLAEKCYEAFDHEIAIRTLEQDIHDMRYDRNLGYFAPIRYDRSRRAYYYENPDYSIDNFPLSDSDLEALTFASAMLDQYRNMEIISDFSGAVQKILDAMKIKKSLSQDTNQKYVGFENSPVISGSEWLTVILDSINEKKVLSLEHLRFDSDEAHHHIVHPYYLKEYRNRWYLVGYQSMNKRIQTYGLERIKELTVLPEERFIDIGFEPEKYYRNAMGVIVTEDPPENILLRFTLKQGNYILTQPIHHSQEVVEETDTHVTIKLHINPTYELVSMILGWGAEVEVIKPDRLRTQVKQILVETVKKY